MIRSAEKTDEKQGGQDPRAIALLHASAFEHVLAGRLPEAKLVCEQALAMDPENPDTMNLLGIVHAEAGEFGQAVQWASRAIGKDPKPQYLTTLGAAFLRLGRRDDAVTAFDTAVQLRPGDATLWWQMGDALIEAERLSDALLCFRRTLALDPNNGDAAYKAGHILYGQEQFEEALLFFNSSVGLRPDHAPTLFMRGLVLKELKRFEEALVDSRRAVELNPANAEAHTNVGAILASLERQDEALSWYERSLQIKPGQASALTNKAAILTDRRRFDEATALYRQALAVDPEYAKAGWNLALLQLLRGDFAAGWRGREVRWKIPSLAQGYPKLSGPMWLGGESVAGKTVMVCQGEGMGDAIQFARYLPRLAARGARVILAVDEPLCPLLSRLPGVARCLPKLSSTAVPPFDVHVAIESLPLAFETRLDSIPAEEAYLPPPAPDRIQAWDDRLGAHNRLRVGLVWSGNPKHPNDRRRSTSLRMMSDLLDVDATFVSLQKNPGPQDVEMLRAMPDVIDHTAGLTDFAETAALVSCLDLVIAVDTSVAHLAAALGRPTWILLPHTPDYRWLLDRDDSPWYPTVRLFRQSETCEYESVIQRMRAELAAIVAAFAAPASGGISSRS
jgi:tetratricopeptide (TPR) repeat protein